MVSAARAAKLLGLGAVLVSATLWTGAAKADVITDDFNFTLSGSTVASGSFSYDSSLTGTQLGFGNLDAFSITIPGSGQTYDLSFVPNAYVQFDFDTLTNSFVKAAVSGPDGTLNELMGASIANSSNVLTSGFFVTPIPPTPGLVATFPFQAVGYDTVTVGQVSAVPEPSTLALLGGAILAFGFFLRRKRVAEDVYAAELEAL